MTDKKDDAAERKARRVEALRANLKRRKAAARRNVGDTGPSAAPPKDNR